MHAVSGVVSEDLRHYGPPPFSANYRYLPVMTVQPLIPKNPPTPTEAPAPASPFERIPQPLRQAIEGRGFTELTSVQIAALDAIDGSRDLRISSQTGSGKTVALGLAIAPELIAPVRPGRGPDALIIVPTRELAAQVHKELEWLYAPVAGVRIDCVTGGTNVGIERRRLRRRPRILVGTPGRLCDHIRSRALDCSGVKQLVLDEADQMLDMGFREDLESILEAIPSEGRRTHMLSATFPAAVRRLTEKYQANPLHVEGTRLGIANVDIAHVGHVVRPHDRYGAIVNLLLLAGDQRTLIFVATRANAASLAEKLAADGFSALALSGDFAQSQRTRTLNAFRSGTATTLVATDVAARGLDVPDVPTIIHGDLPMDGEVYTHRSGRTARAGNKGRSILLAVPNGERRARRLHADAGVEAEWQLLPSAALVEKALTKRMRRRVRKTLEDATDTTNETALEFARKLVEGRDPAQVVATLLAGMRAERPREPFDLQTPMPRSAARAPRNGSTRHGDSRNGNSRQGASRGGYSRQGEEAYTRFRINWGFRDGANASRVLATICRRGDVSSSVIGAIDIDAYSASFDVANDAAREFEIRAHRRDSRDPNQRIDRVPAGRRPKPYRGTHRYQAG